MMRKSLCIWKTTEKGGASGKMITYKMVVIALARYIKRIYKGMTIEHIMSIPITVKHEDGRTEIGFGDNAMSVDGKLNATDVSTIMSSAIHESRCDGVVYVSGGEYKVVLIGKPVAAYKRLARLIERYSCIKNVPKDFVVSHSTNPEEMRYLCHDDKLCEKLSGFVKDNKKRGDSLDVEIRKERDSMLLRLTLVSISGKQKESISVNV